MPREFLRKVLDLTKYSDLEHTFDSKLVKNANNAKELLVDDLEFDFKLYFEIIEVQTIVQEIDTIVVQIKISKTHKSVFIWRCKSAIFHLIYRFLIHLKCGFRCLERTMTLFSMISKSIVKRLVF